MLSLPPLEPLPQREEPEPEFLGEADIFEPPRARSVAERLGGFIEGMISLHAIRQGYANRELVEEIAQERLDAARKESALDAALAERAERTSLRSLPASFANQRVPRGQHTSARSITPSNYPTYYQGEPTSLPFTRSKP